MASQSHVETLALREQFDTAGQQKDASTLGMWLFLITEIMFFGGMFLAYSVYRGIYPTIFAIASTSLNVYIGAANTVVLLCSSFTMVLAVRAAQLGQRRAIIVFLVLTLALGTVFLGVKAYEWKEKFEEHHIPGQAAFHLEGVSADQQGHAQLFFSLYFAMTGLHALHMVIGAGILTVLIFQARRGKFTADYMTPVDVAGLYWHFVDIIWIFLFPLLYLIDRHLK
ncbi:MAG TPA: cytochrome c oxidase subunit 3 family protein [Bryobacteraceae bacterium]|nr:cytochrome c oxidase subunit 3 family protein [Bryobacteraceae bacterium]